MPPAAIPAPPRRGRRSRTPADAPASLEDVRQVLVDRGLSPTSRRAAELILRHPDIVAFGSMTALARRAGVSVRTVIRLLHALGYASFAELRAVCARDLVRDPYARRPEGSHCREILDAVCSCATDMVAGLGDPAVREMLEDAAERLARAETIYLLPDPQLGYLAALVETGARANGMRTASSLSPLVDWPDVLRFARASDAALCLRLTAVEDETERQIAYLKQRGIPTFDPLPAAMAAAFGRLSSARDAPSQVLAIAAATWCECLVALTALRRAGERSPASVS